jgi:hypothetical protein
VRGGSGAAPSQKFIKEIRKIYSFKCVKFFIKDWLIYLIYVNNINVSYAKVVDSNLTQPAISFIFFILLFGGAASSGALDRVSCINGMQRRVALP